MATNFMAQYNKSPLQVLQEAQLANDEAIKAAKAKEEADDAALAASQEQLKAIVKSLFEQQFLLNEFNPRLVKAYLANQDNVVVAVLQLYDRALRNPLVGLRRVDGGFEYNTKFYLNIKELQNGFETSVFGSYIDNGLNLSAFAVLVSTIISGKDSDLSTARYELERQEPSHDLLNVEDVMLLVTYQGF